MARGLLFEVAVTGDRAAVDAAMAPLDGDGATRAEEVAA